MCSPDPTHARQQGRPRQRGLGLVELMIALALGALVVAAALGTLLVAREAAGATSDLGLLQQQAAHAMRIIGAQVRPAGSTDLQALDAGADSSTLPTPFALYAFVPRTDETMVQGEDGDAGGPDRLSVTHLNGSQGAAPRDCLGQSVKAGEPTRATFTVQAGNLRCDNGAGQNQPLADGVASLRVRYRVHLGDGVQHLDAGAVGQAGLWDAVGAVDICVDLQGQLQSPQHPATYLGCDGRPASSQGRLHLLSRQLFALRAPRGPAP